MVQLRLCLDELTMLCFKAQRFGCKWKNYQKFWENWMQISLLDFDSKQERKENMFSIRDIILCPFFPYYGKQCSISVHAELASGSCGYNYLKICIIFKNLYFPTMYWTSTTTTKKNLLDPFSVRRISVSGFIFPPMLILAIWKIQY